MESYNLSNFNVKKESIIKEYYILVKNNIRFLLIINLIVLLIAIAYAVITKDSFVAHALLKINPPKQNILKPISREGDETFGLNRVILNEIETLKNPNIRYTAAKAAYDTLNKLKNTAGFSNKLKDSRLPEISIEAISTKLENDIAFLQKNDLDFIEIYVESQSPTIAMILANAYAIAYSNFNLRENRAHYTTLKENLATQRDEIHNKLIDLENSLKFYKLKGGVIELNEQTSNLISTLSGLEAQKNTNKIELSQIEESLTQYKNELNKRDPSISTYLESKSNEPYLARLRDEVARIQTQKDLASNTNVKDSEILKEYDNKLNDLKSKLQKSMEDYKSSILSASPEEIKDLTTKIFEMEAKYKSLISSNNQLNSVIGNYEKQFNSIPEKSIDIARMERERQTTEKLYMSLETNYQEALVNEKSTPGNVFVMNYAYLPSIPAKPNRKLIILIGLVLGHGLGMLYLFLRNSMSKTVKTPEDIISNKENIISWVPRFNGKTTKIKKGYQLIFINDPESLASEAIRTLRTRIQLTLIEKKAKVLLVTSTAPQEGKSTISSNLSISFAKSHSRTLLIDCDLRAPSVQTIFSIKGTKGLSEFLTDNINIEEIIRKSVFPNLDIIVAGKIPSNPSELLSSPQMEAFIKKMSNSYDVVIVDSPPIMAVSDTEIVSNYVDLSILIVSANKTEIDWMKESTELLKKGRSQFYGVLLNKFNNKSTYHSYYKYYNKDYKKIRR